MQANAKLRAQAAQAIKARLLEQSKHLHKQIGLSMYDYTETKELKEEQARVAIKLDLIRAVIRVSEKLDKDIQDQQESIKKLITFDEVYQQYFPEVKL